MNRSFLLTLIATAGIGSLAQARGIIWDGQYQKVENGANAKRAAAAITVRYK